MNCVVLVCFAVEYLDTGQSNANGLLVLEGSVDGTPADLRDGVMYYCSNRANHRCRIACTIGFPTVHSPSYSINGRCYSAGGMGKDLRPIGINTTHNHPTYTVSFPCHAINYRCVINGTVHSQEVRVQPGNCFQQHGISYMRTSRYSTSFYGIGCTYCCPDPVDVGISNRMALWHLTAYFMDLSIRSQLFGAP